MRWLLILLGVIYLLSPIDCLPDFLLPIGLLDDLVVLGVMIWFLFFRQTDEPPRASKQQRTEKQQRTGESGHTASRPRFRPAHDPFTILEISPNASPDQIRAAYRKKAFQYHPDRVAHMGDEFKELAEKRFKEIQQAYEILMPKNKTR